MSFSLIPIGLLTLTNTKLRSFSAVYYDHLYWLALPLATKMILEGNSAFIREREVSPREVE